MKIKLLFASLLMITHLSFAEMLTLKQCTTEVKKIDTIFQEAAKLNPSETPSAKELSIAKQGVSLCEKGCGDGCYFFMLDNERGTREGCRALHPSEGACMDILMESRRKSKGKSFDVPVAKKLCGMGNKIACGFLHPEKLKDIYSKSEGVQILK